MAEGGRFNLRTGEYEIIGTVTATRDSLKDSMSTPFRDLVRSKACEMGGAITSLIKTRRGLVVGFFVWAKRTRS